MPVVSRLYSRKPALAAAALAFLLVFRYLHRRKRAYSALYTDPSKLARRVNEQDDYDFDEYDVVIVGGGTS